MATLIHCGWQQDYKDKGYKGQRERVGVTRIKVRKIMITRIRVAWDYGY